MRSMPSVPSSISGRPNAAAAARWIGWSWVFLVVMMAAPTAQAAGKEAKERAARTACLTGDYVKGVALLAELYVDTLDPGHIFNQGRCFQQNGKYEEAILRFREFQRKHAEAGREPDAATEKHIADCQALLGQPKSPAPPAQSTAPPAPVVAPTAPVETPIPQAEAKPAAAAAPSEGPTVIETNQSSSPGGGLRIAGIATAALGLGGIATGVILNLKANALSQDLEAANRSTTTFYTRSKASTRSSYQTWGWVAYGTGAACLAGGAVLYYLGYRQAHSVAFMPTLADGHVGAALQGAF